MVSIISLVMISKLHSCDFWFPAWPNTHSGLISFLEPCLVERKRRKKWGRKGGKKRERRNEKKEERGGGREE